MHQDLGHVILNRFVEQCADISKVDQPIRSEGRTLSVTLAPEAKKPVKKEKSASDAPADVKQTSTENAQPSA